MASSPFPFFFFLHLYTSIGQLIDYYVFKFALMTSLCILEYHSAVLLIQSYVFEKCPCWLHIYLFYSFYCFVVFCLIPQYIHSLFDAYLDGWIGFVSVLERFLGFLIQSSAHGPASLRSAPGSAWEVLVCWVLPWRSVFAHAPRSFKKAPVFS